ncbi:MAG: ATP phosphoribosyltransferase [Actinobacteria bacterium]|nr:ATP phosphoribosyltransferase [Actinomycetota bacterium]
MTLKIALPNKGSLSESAINIFKEAGFRQRSDAKDLIFLDPENDVEFYYLRPRDIAIYVGSGELDLGVTGRDLLLDSGAAAIELLNLNFGASTFRFASREGSDLSGKRIATAYPGLLQSYLTERSIKASIVSLDGAVESAISLGVADVIADVVSTGSTLRQAGLKVFGDPILESVALLIARKHDSKYDLVLRRIQGVVIARQYVLVDYDVPKNALDAACKITPGFESPTISPLQNENWVAVRAMVLRKGVHKIMDDLYDVGARGILVTDIHASRL